MAQPSQSRSVKKAVAKKTAEKSSASRTSLSRVQKPRPRRRQRERPVRLSTSILLRKFAELSVMAAFIGAAFAYQLSLPDRALEAIHGWMVSANGGSIPGPVRLPREPLAVVLKDLMPFLSAGKPIRTSSGVPLADGGFIRFYGSLPVLELKALVWLLIAGIGVGAYACGRGWEKAVGVNVFPPDPSPRPLWKNPWRLIPMLAGVLFLGWALVSFLPVGPGWPPPVPDAVVEVLASGTDEGVDTSSGGFQQSMLAWLMVACGLAFLVMAEDVIRTRRLVYKILGMIFGVGVVAALVSILVEADAPVFRSVWIQWGDADYRNDVGGFIGHNTAVSSFLMAPLLIAWTLFASARRRMKMQVALAACMALMCTTIIMAQSRAVVPILGAVFVALVYLLARRASIRPSIRFLVGVPLALFVLVTVQFVPHKANPFYRENLPLAQRIRHMSGEHLLTETRLRILLCSLPSVAEHPIGGTGWGSFHYVYPQVQGEYYRDRPRSRILPTPKKTFRAHNEYLQTLFETGGVGLALALAGVVTMLMAGWRHMRHSFRQRHIALQIAVFLGICALLMHAVFDFPLRVAPLACTLVLLLAVWSAGDRLWVIRTKGLEERRADAESGTDARMLHLSGAREIRMEMKLRREKRRGGGFNPLAALWIAGAACAFAAVAAGGMAAATWFGSAVSVQRAGNAIGNWTAPGQSQNRALMAEALDATGIATRLSPFNGEALFKEAQARQYLATDLIQERADLERLGGVPQQQLDARVREAADMIRGSFFAADRSMTQYYYHGSWRVRGFCEYLAFTISRRTGDIDKAMKSMAQAVAMNPGDFETARLLIDWKEQWERPVDRESLLELYRSLKHFNPEYFAEQYVEPMDVLLAIGEYESGLRYAERLVEVSEGDAGAKYYARAAAFRAGRIDALAEWNRRMPSEEDGDAELYRAYQLLAEGNVEAAQRELAAIPRDNPLARSVGAATGICIDIDRARRAGDASDVDRLVSDLMEMAAQEPSIPFESVRVLESCFGDYETAQEIMRRTVAVSANTDPFTPKALLAYLLAKPYDEKLNRILADRAEAIRAGETPPALGDGAVRDALGEALRLNHEAMAVCMSKPGREALDRRIRALEALLFAGPPK